MKKHTLPLAVVLLSSVTALLAGCTPTVHVNPKAEVEQRPTAEPSPFDDLGGREVVAVVERLQESGYVEFLPNGMKRWSNLVVLAIVEPRQVPERIHVHSLELAIGNRPLQVGDHLAFIMPLNSAVKGLGLSDLEELELRDRFFR